MPLPPDGHLGVLNAIRHHVDFLFGEDAFAVIDEQPTQMRLAAGAVAIELGWATQATSSFSLSRTDHRDFGSKTCCIYTATSGINQFLKPLS